MNKRLVMWGTFFVVFLLSIFVSYRFINQNEQDMAIELSAPTLPLVSAVVQGEQCNALHGYLSDMNVSDVAQYIFPLGEERVFKGQIEAYGTAVQSIRYELRNNEGSRLIESGSVTWRESTPGVLDFDIKLKDLIERGEEYILTLILGTEQQEAVRYYTRLVYGEVYDLEAQVAFVRQLHAYTLDKTKQSELAVYLETDWSLDNTSLAYVNIKSSAAQAVWGELQVAQAGEERLYITFLQDGYGAYTLEYYASSEHDGEKEYYHVTENFLVSTFGEKLYLLDYERTADSIFQYEADVYQNDKIALSIQSRDISVAESEDGNMAAFVVNGTLYYYDDNSNEINYVYGFLDGVGGDERSAYYKHDIEVLQVGENGSIYFVVGGYMNRGSHEGKVGAALYFYNGLTKLIDEVGFYESSRSAEYVLQEMQQLVYLSRQDKFYFYVDGNIAVCDITTGDTTIWVAYEPQQKLYISEDCSSVVVDDGEQVRFLMLESGTEREVTVSAGGRVIPQGFIGNDFVYGIAYVTDNVLQSDGTYAQYMREIFIQNAKGELQKQYREENVFITSCTITGNQILLERVHMTDGEPTAAAQDQIVASKSSKASYNEVAEAMTATYQTIKQISLKNKIDVATLKYGKAKEVFFEGRRSITVPGRQERACCAVYSPWGIKEYTADAGEAMRSADALEGFARDEGGRIIWKKAATVTKNQIMAIELEQAGERSSKEICLDMMLKQIGSPCDVATELAQGKTCQQILEQTAGDYGFMDVTGSSLAGLLYYVNQDIPVMVLYDTGEAVLITGFNQFNIVVMDPVNNKLGYMSRSDAAEMLEETKNQVFTYYRKHVN